MARDKRGTHGKTNGGASRRDSLAGSETVISDGKSYKQFMVGDRLESRSARNPRPSSFTASDYSDYLAGFDGSGKSAARSKKSHNKVSSRDRFRNRGRANNAFDSAPPGSPIKDVAKKYLPMLRVRLTASVVSAIIFGLMAYHIYMSIYVDYTTEKVTVSPYLETIDVEGVAIRDERIIDGTLSKSAVKAVQNGEKVSKGDPIINIFSSVSEAAAYERVTEIDREIERLKNMATAPDDSANTVAIISKQLDNKMVNLNAAAHQRKMSEVASLKEEISYLLNKRMVAMGLVGDYNDRIDQLTKEREELNQKYFKNPESISAPDSGYFADSCDGYETLLNTSMVEDLTVDKLDKIMKKKVSPPEKAIGKLVGSFSWYLACPISAIDSDFLVENSIYKLYLPYSEEQSISAVLERINKQDGQDKFLAIFRCSSLASELCTVRVQPVKIEKCIYEGYAIQKSALHAGVKDVTVKNPHPDDDFPKAHLVYVSKTTYPSVYVIVAGQIKEKEVSIIYGTDKLVICSPKHGDDYLSIGDTVVIAERGLYDGKLVR